MMRLSPKIILSILCAAAAFMGSATEPALANDAKHCVKLTTTGKSGQQKLLNDCDVGVVVVWCSTGDRTRPCDRSPGSKFYRYETSLDHGRTAGNQFSMPKGAAVHYGACFGKRTRVYFSKDGTGRYSCGGKLAIKGTVMCGSKKVNYLYWLRQTPNNQVIIRAETMKGRRLIQRLPFNARFEIKDKAKPSKVRRAIWQFICAKPKKSRTVRDQGWGLLKKWQWDEREKRRRIIKRCRAQVVKTPECKRLIDSLPTSAGPPHG